MFNCCIADSSAVVVDEDTPNVSKVAESPSAPEKPRPMIFALMRNGHEVIRGGHKNLQAALEEEDFDKAKGIYEKNKMWQELHAKMEDGIDGGKTSPIGMFALLDKHFDGAASNEGLDKEHQKLEEAEHALEKAFQVSWFSGGNLDAAKKAFEKFDEENLAHLKKEEDLMMPLVGKMTQTGHPMKKYMQEELLATIIDDPRFESWVKYANEVLEKYSDGMPRVRVFDHALWAVATDEQWATWNEWIKDTLSEDVYNEIQAVIAET